MVSEDDELDKGDEEDGRETGCDEYCNECKLIDKKDDPFPELRRIFDSAGSDGEDMVPAAGIEERIKARVEQYRDSWGPDCKDSPMITLASEKLVWCHIKGGYVWVGLRYFGSWRVFGSEAVPVDGFGHPIK